MVALKLRHEELVFDPARGVGDDLHDQLLGLVIGRARRGDVQRGDQFLIRGIDRRDGAGQRRVVDGEVIVHHHRDRLTGRKTGADAVGALKILLPDHARIESGLPRLPVDLLAAAHVHGDPVRVGQQDHVIQLGEAFVQPIQFRRKDRLQHIEAVAQRRDLDMAEDDGLTHLMRFDAVGKHTTPPGGLDGPGHPVAS